MCMIEASHEAAMAKLELHGRRPWGLAGDEGEGARGGRLRGGGREGRASWGGCYWSSVWAARCGLLVRKNSWGRKEREGGLKKRERKKNKRKEKNGKFAKPGYFREKNKR
jgi:hypothetical protein